MWYNDIQYSLFSYYILSSMQLLFIKSHIHKSETSHCSLNTCMSDSEDTDIIIYWQRVLTKCAMKASRYRSHLFHVISVCVLINHNKWHTTRRFACHFVCVFVTLHWQALPTPHSFILNMFCRAVILWLHTILHF